VNTLAAGKRSEIRVRAENPFNAVRELREKRLRSLFESGVLSVKTGDPVYGEVERIAAGAECVPAEISIPVPVQVGAVDLLEREAPPRRGVLAAREFRVVKHVETRGKSSLPYGILQVFLYPLWSSELGIPSVLPRNACTITPG
jgi:hypothetical protein